MYLYYVMQKKKNFKKWKKRNNNNLEIIVSLPHLAEIRILLECTSV